MTQKIYISREPYKHNPEFKVPANFKLIKLMSLEELKTAYNTRLVEKNEASPMSVFHKFWDEEMIWITNEIKRRKIKTKQ